MNRLGILASLTFMGGLCGFARAQQPFTDINGIRVRASDFVGDPGTIKTITPTPDSSTLSPIPSSLTYEETNFTNTGAGFQANRARFILSNDAGQDPRFLRNVFGTQDTFDYSMDLKLQAGSIAPRKEAGLRIDFNGFDGLFIVNTDSHEIVAFGGTLPFYSFNTSNGLSYNAGDTINMRMIYKPPVLDATNMVVTGKEGTIEYIVNQGSGPVSSGPLKFTGNEGGIIDGSTLGFYEQATGAVNDSTDFVRATFSNIMVQTSTGDFDRDGDVDGADFLAWQTNQGLTTGASREQGDSNADNIVNDVDLAAWKAYFGSPSPLATAVPEPASMVLIVGMVALGMDRARRRHSR